MDQKNKNFTQSIGPVSPFELKQVEIFFERNKINFDIEIDADLKMEADQNLQIHGNGEFDPVTRSAVNRFGYNHAKFIYVSLSAEDALKSKSFLTDLSLSLNRTSSQLSLDQEDKLLAAEDYMCVDCDFSSLHPGSCPKHGTRLLPYFERLKAKYEKESQSFLSKFFYYIIGVPVIIALVGGLFAAVIYVIYRLVLKI